ncbi:MAG TPA: GtrA family protein, partial [Phenylobacterium sp.]|nr:GtrA family protein [Phenylobacterium sp.]
TAVGFAVIAALDIGLHMTPALANAAGYAVGIPLGFALNRGFVFRHGGGITRAGLRYAAATALALALNQLVLRLAGVVLGAGAGPHLAAQLAAMATYTGVGFLTFRFWVFRQGGA